MAGKVYSFKICSTGAWVRLCVANIEEMQSPNPFPSFHFQTQISSTSRSASPIDVNRCPRLPIKFEGALTRTFGALRSGHGGTIINSVTKANVRESSSDCCKSLDWKLGAATWLTAHVLKNCSQLLIRLDGVPSNAHANIFCAEFYANKLFKFYSDSSVCGLQGGTWY